jgi:resuscitation-promoting factor RpfB
MKSFQWLIFSLALVLTSCQPNGPVSVTIIDGDQVHTFESSERVPLDLLNDSNIPIQSNDRILFNGLPVPINQAITNSSAVTLQIRRTVIVTLNTPQGLQTIQTSALTVGEALIEAGIQLNVNDQVDPPAITPIEGQTLLTVNYIPSRNIAINIDGKVLQIQSSARTVGEALAEAGIPLIGLDTSSPLEHEALPIDGQIRVARVNEVINVALEQIPFETQRIDSVDVPLGQEEIIQSGVNGLTMIRTRIRYEDGKEISKTIEDETVMRESQTQIVNSGTQIVLAPVGGDIPYQYWYATEMYASWYSPCNSGTGSCSYGTASGARAGHGIVAVDYSIYSYLAGMKVYIPGYGVATIGDTGGGPIVETAFGVQRTQWIDLGYDDNAIGGLSGWVTVYFLEPAPAEIPYFLK